MNDVESIEDEIADLESRLAKAKSRLRQAKPASEVKSDVATFRIPPPCKPSTFEYVTIDKITATNMYGKPTLDYHITFYCCCPTRSYRLVHSHSAAG